MKQSSFNTFSEQNATKGGVTLPRIQSAGRKEDENNDDELLLEGQPVDNPFYIPEDYEIFKMKEKEKEIRRQERQKNANLKIWEKGIKSKGAFTVGRLNELCKIDEENDDDYAKLNIVDAAKSAIKNRVRQKEPMHQFLEKKREMLLFQMLIDHKREQINQFEELTRLHKKGLEKSEQMLEEDLKRFNDFLEKNKNKSRQTIKDAEDETKKKQEKINEIKQLQELKADLTTKNTQKIENLEEMLRYKKFLDQITPKDKLDEINQRKNQRKNLKSQYSNQGKSSGQLSKKKYEAEQFHMNISKELQVFLDDSDEEFEQHFNKPSQLEGIFQDLEEKNLFLIFNTKETEQKVEEIKKEFEQKKHKLNSAKQTLLNQKQDLLKQQDLVNEQTKQLKMVKANNETQQQLQNLENEIYKIYKVDFLGDKQQDVRKDLQGIEMLREMENALEFCINEVSKYIGDNSQLVAQKEKDYYNKKRQNRNNDPSRQEQEQLLLLQKQKEQAKQKKEKRYGRPIMAKSRLQKQEKKEKEQVNISEDSLDNSRYFS